MSVSFLKRGSAPALGYRHDRNAANASVTVMFLCGFRSDMEGTKAAFLSDVCREEGLDYLRFDYSGHGVSEGRFADLTIGSWTKDALAIIDMTAGPLLLVGSSMGGWIGLSAALAREDRVRGFIGLAAAPDFTREFEDRMSGPQREMLEEQGFFILPDGMGGTFSVTKKFLEDGAAHGLLNGAIDLDIPVRLVHGARDEDVPPETAERIVERLTSTDAEIIIRPHSGHRLSGDEDLQILKSLTVDMARKIRSS